MGKTTVLKMDRHGLKLFSTQIETWGYPLLIRAYDKEDAEELTRILFKVPSNVDIKATEYYRRVAAIAPSYLLLSGDCLFPNRGVAGKNDY